MDLKIGDSAPLFCLQNQDGIEICLRDLKGGFVVLYFYPKDSTPGCTTEACEFTANRHEFLTQNAQIFGVSPDSLTSHQKFIQKQNLSITLLSDPTHQCLESYGAWGEKKMYGKVYMGVIRSTFIINPEGKIVAIWRNVKVKGHVEAVLKELQKLG
ncbi:thioredoxin-dependent thiol peroxidase [Helicobacter monodelphidis]|uniref:thioredoxin-dependent thiol peroxidase n=1 Tax=Helicobacter sp. 15-1451 TaxID=2004995 RepID=UPI000DCC1AC6|nr:thioredoxin-dependent thiol peroxidase [Helicobacter sp. 15-1451]RAX58026.1 thioredoxin-dependent thiol peroxidase [Helicobacter sp. 15-1451]